MKDKERRDYDEHEMLMSKLFAEKHKNESDTALNRMKIKWYWSFIVIAIIGAISGIVSLILQLLG